MNYLSCQYLSFKEFVEKYGLKNEATSNVKIKEILNMLRAFSELDTACGIYMRDDKFTTTSGIVNLHPTKETHLDMFNNDFFLIHMAVHLQLIYLITFKKVSIQNIKFRKMIVIVRRFVYVLYLTQIIGFKNAVLNLYYQTFKLNK